MARKLAEVIKSNPGGLIARAYDFAQKAHAGQKRKSGEPYFVHPASTAQTLLDWQADETTIAAGLLHDTMEDCGISQEELCKNFGEDVVFLVNGVTKLGKVKYRKEDNKEVAKNTTEKPTEKHMEVGNLRKLILAISKDIRVVMIKLADRLHNMTTLAALPPAKQKRIAIETDEIYAPLAYRLGMHQVSGELQDLAFPYLYPKESEWMKKNMGKYYETHTKYLENLKPIIEKALKDHHIDFESIDFRAKRYSSLYKKLIAHNMDPDKIYDLVAMRIIVAQTEGCYGALGVIHSLYPPLPGRIKDYIAMPKPNGYRSLHTTVIGPENKIVEFQIRTREMHEENEHGIAAHWAYKEGTKNNSLKKEMAWVSQLKAWQDKFENLAQNDPEEFLQSMKIDFFKDRIFVMTPRGAVLDLPAGSTPIDFAYHIHSDIGNSCSSAKVNGAFVSLSQELQSGDMVEVMIQKGKKPSEDWLQFVKTQSAKEHIRASLKKSNPSLRPIEKIEYRITSGNKIGLLKNITGIIARSHINLADVALHHQAKDLVIIRIVLENGDLAKAQKIALKIKEEVEEVREINVRLINK